MSRLLRQDPEDHERQHNLRLADGVSIMMADLKRQQTFARMHATQAEILSISREEGGDRKRRFEAEATHGGPKIRRDQGHKLPVQRAPGARNRDRRRYLIHATEPGAAIEIPREACDKSGTVKNSTS